MKGVMEMEGRETPLILERSFEYIKQYGKEVEGIFRVPGDNHLIFSFKLAYDTGYFLFYFYSFFLFFYFLFFINLFVKFIYFI